MFDNGVVTSEKRDNYEETQLRQRNGRKNNSILSRFTGDFGTMIN